MTHNKTSRRDFLALAAILGITPAQLLAQEQMPRRQIPRTDESLPIIGLGSSKPVAQIADRGTGPITEVLQALVAKGGSVVDTWPRNAANDAALGEVINRPDLRGELFVASKIDRPGKEAGVAQFRETQRLYGRETLDLLQVFSLTDIDAHWATLKDLKVSGDVRYIGATVASESLYEALERFVTKEVPDFIQINYSITEREAEERMLSLLQGLGIGVIVNRPFMNGDYFRKLEDQPVPEWAADFDCHTWAQFSLKYILAHPAVNCVLTETSNPAHMVENCMAAYGRLPNVAERQKMQAVIDAV
jgi:diketogulonate reductase-like aldo/keto reductase